MQLISVLAQLVQQKGAAHMHKTLYFIFYRKRLLDVSDEAISQPSA